MWGLDLANIDDVGRRGDLLPSLLDRALLYVIAIENDVQVWMPGLGSFGQGDLKEPRTPTPRLLEQGHVSETTKQGDEVFKLGSEGCGSMDKRQRQEFGPVEVLDPIADVVGNHGGSGFRTGQAPAVLARVGGDPYLACVVVAYEVHSSPTVAETIAEDVVWAGIEDVEHFIGRVLFVRVYEAKVASV